MRGFSHSIDRISFQLVTHLVNVRQIEHGGLHDLVDQMRSDFGHLSTPGDQNHVVALQKTNEAHDAESGDFLDLRIVVRDLFEDLWGRR